MFIFFRLRHLDNWEQMKNNRAEIKSSDIDINIFTLTNVCRLDDSSSDMCNDSTNIQTTLLMTYVLTVIYLTLFISPANCSNQSTT